MEQPQKVTSTGIVESPQPKTYVESSTLNLEFIYLSSKADGAELTSFEL